MDFLQIFYVGIYVVMIYLALIWIILALKNKKNFITKPINEMFPALTFLVPAYNEEKNIGKCLNGLLSLDYPKDKLKIIVINDGSKDRTGQIAESFKKFGVMVLNKENGGKAVALNYGMDYVKTDLVGCMDADSVPERDYLKIMMRHFRDPEVAAVTSAIKVNAMDSFFRRMQWAEYLITLGFRKLFSFLDCQFTIPGAGGIYKTNVLRKIGLFAPNNITEDMEIALRLHAGGYKIENSFNAFVVTNCPKTFRSLLRQRMRWYRGYIENYKDYRFMIFNPKYGNFGLFFAPMTIAWIGLIVTVLLLQTGLIFYDIAKSFLYWGLVNYQVVLPTKLYFLDFFAYDSLKLALSIHLVLGLFLTILMVRKLSNVKFSNKKGLITVYLFLYPYLFAFFWFMAILYTIFRVNKKW